MWDTTVTKVSSRASPTGEMGQAYLASGKSLGMRLWRDVPPGKGKTPSRRDYETVGYVLKGIAELRLEGEVARLEPGDSWVVPRGAEHAYDIIEEFSAVEATSPPAHAHAREG